MKIAHVVWGLGMGGIETMLSNIANEQSAMGHDVHIVVINDIYVDDIIKSFDPKVKIHFLRRRIGSKNPLPIIQLNLLAGRINPDIIHFHDLSMPRLLLNKYIAKSCTTLHNDCEAFKHELHLAKRNNYFVGVTQTVANDIHAISGRPTTAILNGINIAHIKQKNEFCTDGVFKIVQVGRLDHPQKGQHILLQAIKTLIDQGLKVLLDIIGEGKSRTYLENMVKENSLDDYINFLGHKSQMYIFEHLRDYDLFVQPSLFEGFGLTVAEAMAAKIPILISNIDPLLEVTDNGRYGAVFTSGDPQSCANSILQIAKHYDYSKVDEAYDYVRDHYDVKITAKKYINTYKTIIN